MTRRSNSNWGWLLGVLVAAALTAAVMTSQGKRHPVRTPVGATAIPNLYYGYRTSYALVDWERPVGLERLRLGMSRLEAWKSMGEANRWDRMAYDDPDFELWRSRDYPARQVAFGRTGEIVALTGQALFQDLDTDPITPARVQEAQAVLGPPDHKEQTTRGETWLWTRHPKAGYLKLYVKHLTFALSKDEDTPF